MADTTQDWRVPSKDALDFRHPEWKRSHDLWEFTKHHYTAEVLRPDLVTTYLKQKRQGETNAAFKERCDNADYTNHFGTVVDSLVGMLGQVDDDASRVWGLTKDDGTVQGLGDPKEEDTPAAQLWRDADGQGNSWLTFWSVVATELSLTHMGWLMVDPRDTEADSVVRYLDPGCVVNWRYEDGRLVEVLILEEVDTRTGLWEDPQPVQQYLHLTLDGWARYRVADESVRVVDGPSAWDQAFEDDAGNPTLLVRQVVLPVRRMVGYYLAKKANALFNRESERDHIVRVANFPKFLTGKVTGDEFDSVVKSFKTGNNVLQSDGRFDAPDTSSATLATDINEKKARELYMTAFREYGDAARERTATEVKQDVAAGAGAYLTLLSRTLDQAETWALHLLTQIETPKQPDLWFAASVSRSTAFAPSDPDAALDRLLARVFGKDVPVPVGRTAQENAALEAATYMGLNADPEQLKAAVAARGITDAMAVTELSFPAAVRVQAMASVIASMGLIDPKQVVKLADGSEKSLLAVVMEESEKLAQADDLAKQREAQFFDIGGRMPVPPPGDGEIAA